MLKEQDLTQRLKAFAEFFLGTQYGAWVDGSTIDSDDDFNYQVDKLDCVTFVEIVLALAKIIPSDNYKTFSSDFENMLAAIHYTGRKRQFICRNHFMCLDWIPNNQFIVEDITLSLYANAKIAEAKIDKLSWLKKHNIFKSQELILPVELEEAWVCKLAKVAYLETKTILDQYERLYTLLPDATIFNIVRPNWDLKEQIGTNLNISHLGFVLKSEGKKLIFYHATSVDEKQVVKQELRDYLLRYQDSPTIKGFNVLRIKPGFYKI